MKNFKLISMPCLVALLGITANFSLSVEAKAQNAPTRAPQTVTPANVARVNLTLEHQPNESYDILIRRAETAARNATAQTFNQNRAVGAVVVTIIGQNAGAIAPLLSLQVNRQTWASLPDTQRWATYFKNASSLLGLGTPGANVANQPTNQPAAQVPANGNASNGTTTPNNTGIQVLPNGSVVTTGNTVPSNAATPNNNFGSGTPNNSIGNNNLNNTVGNNNYNNNAGTNSNFTPVGRFGDNSFNNNDTNGNVTPVGQFGGNSNFNNTDNNGNLTPVGQFGGNSNLNNTNNTGTNNNLNGQSNF